MIHDPELPDIAAQATARAAWEEIQTRLLCIKGLANVAAYWGEQIEHRAVRDGISAMIQAIEGAARDIEGELPTIWSALGGVD